MFVDRITVLCKAGKGGNGVIAWRREKFIPKGGPAGGNGGKGGSIVLESDVNASSLDWFKNRRILKAKDGQAGGSNCKQGKNGPELVLKVPCGTLLKDSKTQEVIFDFTEPGQTFILCKGGKGGKGNWCFRSPTNQAPNICTPGQPGQEQEVELELKLIADVGFIGFPNAGKSTLISSLCNVEVRIAAYPFTTLQPNLGFISYKGGKRILVADIPGIIEGAHRNRGLGFEFLRHIERTKVLIFVLDAAGYDARSPLEDFEVLQKELSEYDPNLLKRPFLIALNKCDLEDSSLFIEEFKKKYSKHLPAIFCISALSGDGLKEVREEVYDLVFGNEEVQQIQE
jgi:GTPase